jgi:RNA polymerase nonessential primary-like sigma factor
MSYATLDLLEQVDAAEIDTDADFELMESSDKRGNSGSKDLFSDYLREIGRYKLLTRKEEIDLGTKVQEMMQYEEVRRKLKISLEDFIKVRRLDKKEIHRIYKVGNKAKEQLITHNLRLVVSVARRYNNINLSIYDMVQEGNLGLIRGAEKYNPIKYNVKFSTYASWWIKESINKGITNGGRSIRLPVHVTDKIRILRKAKREFYVKYNRQPSVTELMTITGFSRDMLNRVSPYVTRPVSLDTKMESDLSLIDYIADPTILEYNPALMQEHLENTVKDILSCVSEQEQRVLMNIFGLLGTAKMDTVELASVENLTTQQVGALKRNALKKLQAEFGELPEVKRVILNCLQ